VLKNKKKTALRLVNSKPGPKKKAKKLSTKITFRLEPSMYAEFVAYCEEVHQSPSDLLRSHIKATLDSQRRIKLYGRDL